MRKWMTVWVTMLMFCVLLPVRAAAANPQKVTLNAGVSYKRYDITGDQKADTLQIVMTGKNYSNGKYCYAEGLTVSVNGKKVYAFRNNHYYDIKAVLYTLKNKKPFLYLYAEGDNGDGPVCGLFQYRNGVLKQVINFQTFYKYASHRSGQVKSVSGNEMTVTFFSMSYALSAVDVTMRYKYKNGTLRLVSRTGTAYSYAQAYHGSLTARKKITAYKSAVSDKKTFTLSSGTKVKVTNCYINGKNIRFKVKRLSDGKTGWIKSPTKFLSGGKGLFEEASYAG